jgi:hypothetical protein
MIYPVRMLFWVKSLKKLKKISFLRALNFDQSSSNLTKRWDKFCRSIMVLSPVFRRYGSAVIPDQSFAL